VTVRIECLGDVEKGTEFWVVRPDGTREAHQCKRENASGGRWSVAKHSVTTSRDLLHEFPALCSYRGYSPMAAIAYDRD